MQPAFIVLYRWRLRPGSEVSFAAAWSRVSELLKNERGSLGSRLHRGSDGLWYSYAQWPTSESRAKAFDLGPVDSEAGAAMDAAIVERLPDIFLEPVSDFLAALALPNNALQATCEDARA
jgi:heme-degrading monooxygenase HmoA